MHSSGSSSKQSVSAPETSSMSAPASPAVAHRATKGKRQQYSEATWPDPTALPHASPQVDDVSRLNATEVERVFEVRTPDDVKVVLRRASEEGRQVSVRGTQHSMGGHTIAPGGYVLDMRHFDRLAYDPATELVSAGTGAHWTDLIYYLNQFGLSPRTMQSYSSFSVGGTVSVNAHGITTDHCLAESIESFTLITADARELVCSRAASDEDARELFSLAIGGYGLFGIITEVTLKVNPNLHLELDLLRVAPKDFGRVYRSLLAADPDQGGDVDIKMARLDITNLEHIELYVFRRASSVKTVSPLDLTPREMSLSSRLIYKWLAPTLQELRFTVERTLGTAFDWSQTNDRNGLMYESAVPLARLYSPLLHIDDTFILQEYFVPQKSFLRWVEQVKPIYRRIAQHPLVSLLNTTIRFVRQDTETALAYARSPEGVYAFVLYYRIRRTTEADEALRHFHEELTEVTLSVHGTFYLPYRHHYSFDQLEQAYGRQTLLSFLERKEKYDPGCLFSSLWLRKYGSAYASDAYRKLILSAKSVSRSSVPPVMPVKSSLGSADASFEVPLVSERRKDSYRRLFHNALLRRRFLEEFLVHVFNIEDPSTLFRLISQAVWEPDNATDLDVYSHLQAALVTESAGPLNMVKKTWRQLKQLRDQKEEIARETVSIMSRLGKIGQLHDYVSIGDNGKMVLPLREALGMRGQVWVVHDVRPESTEIPIVLERGSVEPLGQFVLVDYQDVTTPRWAIPDESADLVTMNQGLHHLPQTDLMKFLAEVRRVLRPGGLFIVREHNARPVTPIGKGEAPTSEVDLIPMLDLAHSVFNVVTGVSLHDERNEIRAFRSVLGWREIIEAAGLVDTMLYEVQSNDPTIDEMMCFYKPPFTRHGQRDDLPALAELQLPAPPPFVPVLANLFKQVPATALEVLRKTIDGLITNLPTLTNTLVAYLATTSSAGVSHVAKQAIDRITAEVTIWLERFRPFIESSAAGDEDAALNFLPPELFLIVPALNKRVALGVASPMEMVAAAFLHDIQASFVAEPDKSPTNSDHGTPASISTRGFTPAEVTEKLRALTRALPDLLEPKVLDDLEVPALAQRAIRSFLAASASARELEASGGASSPGAKPEDKLAPASEGAVRYLDLQAWRELSAALDEITKRKAAPPPLHEIIATASSKEALQGSDSAAMWARALTAMLGSPLVYLTHTLVLQLRLVGIDGVYKAWALAQKRRKAQRSEDSAHEDEAEESASPLLQALKPFTDPPCNEVAMEEGHFADLHNVAEVISATYGYTSITARPTDVTAIIAARLKHNTIHLANLPSSKLHKQREVVPLFGSLDRLRKAVTLNTFTLNIRYRPVLETDPTYQRKVDELLLQLSEHGWVKPLHKNDGHFTWFKLPEWMQVEMVQIFGESMNHTPWYRFPFMSFIKLYFEVLLKEVGIVRSEHGLLKAILSNAFFTDLVPGVVMFGLFLQLQLLALPVKSIGGEEYTPELMVEQVVLFTPPSRKPIKWERIDERISAQQVAEGEGLYILTVPTFKPLTEILLRIAKKLPQSQVLEISNQRVVQIKITLPTSADTDEAEAALLAKIDAVAGCSVMFHYRFPVDGASASSRPSLCVSLRVTTLAIVRLLQVCAQLEVSVSQVYDFYA